MGIMAKVVVVVVVVVTVVVVGSGMDKVINNMVAVGMLVVVLNEERELGWTWTSRVIVFCCSRPC